MAKRLQIAFLGGVEEVGKNMTLLEYGDTAILVDAGLGFPDSETMPGVDFIIPDLDYLISIKDKIKGIFITHGHEDHIGSLPFVLQEMNVPVYGSAISVAFAENKLERRTKKKIKRKFITVENGDVIKAGPFAVEFIRVTHSIAGAYAFSITTPVGIVFMTGDFKIDHTPVDGERADLSKIAAIGEKGVLLLMSDSTNATKPGYSMSESKVGESLSEIFNANRKQRIIVATFASNIHRIRQIIECAGKYYRKIAFGGRSLQNTMEIARKLGEIKFDDEMVVEPTAKIPDDRICLIVTGTQGEEMSALSRMSSDTYKGIRIGENDTIIISASSIPGNEKSILRVINNLSKRGANVIYESLREVHASGHAYTEELKLMFALTKPRYFIPVHGEFRHMKAHAQLAVQMGMPKANIYIPELGDVLSINRAGIKKLPSINAKGVMLIGDRESETEEIIERKKMAEEGIVVVAITISGSGKPSMEIDLTSKGVTISEKLESEIYATLHTHFGNTGYKDMVPSEISKVVRSRVSKLFYATNKRSPMVIPIVMVE
ncbi:MAG TPA: ribonuclease J [Clostridia bacterium]|nr:ribonuclease J [Clostridia bacterium]